MADQKRQSPPPPSSGDSPPPPSPPPLTEHLNPPETETYKEGNQLPLSNQPQPNPEEHNDSDAEGGSPSPPSSTDHDEFILVKLADIRKDVQCPICLGIIRKTRTVMECLHRFCRECIDKSMRLGNNECPACRTHCASRRSLRDDPNYDTLIETLYPDIDKYEEEELAFHEEEKTRNRKIQESIAETLRRQSEALSRRRPTAKATAAAFVRKSQGNLRRSYQRGRGRSSGRDTTITVSDDDEEEDDNGNDKDSSSTEEHSPEVRHKRRRRWTTPRSSPARALANGNTRCNESDDLAGRETPTTSPLRVGKREMLAWGKGAARSQNRHGNSSGYSGRFFKGSRVAKMVEYFRHLDENEEYDIQVTLLPFDIQSMIDIQRPYLCCRPTLSIRHICQFIALQAPVQTEGIELLIRKHQVGTSINMPSDELRVLGAQESLGELHASFSTDQRILVLFYRCKVET